MVEWIGRFAFLHHARGISAYCLRRGKRGHCMHQKHEDTPSTLLPDEWMSIFREGCIDLGVLDTAYGGDMRTYHDTLLVVFDEDEERKRVLKRTDSKDIFVRIPLYQTP